MNRVDLHAYDLKIDDCLAWLDAAHADADRQHLVPDLTTEVVTLKANRAELDRRLGQLAA